MDDQITNCINYSPAFDISEVINGDIEIAFQPFNPDVISGLVFISANHTYLNRKKPTIFGYAFNYSISLDNMNVYAPKSYLDFGAAPMLKFFKTNGTIYVLEVYILLYNNPKAHTHSSAPCGTLINNADTFKCGVPNTKIGHKAMMQSVPYILNYNWGTFAAIQERILAGNFLGPCDKKVMHAKYGNGDFPDGIVYFNQTTQHLQALMVNQHIPFVDLPAFSKLFTGARVPDGPFVETLELNIFDVVDFDTLKIF